MISALLKVGERYCDNAGEKTHLLGISSYRDPLLTQN